MKIALLAGAKSIHTRRWLAGLKNPEHRKSMGAAGRRFVENRYKWSVSVDIMEEVYRKYVEKHTSGGR